MGWAREGNARGNFICWWGSRALPGQSLATQPPRSATTRPGLMSTLPLFLNYFHSQQGLGPSSLGGGVLWGPLLRVWQAVGREASIYQSSSSIQFAETLPALCILKLGPPSQHWEPIRQ